MADQLQGAGHIHTIFAAVLGYFIRIIPCVERKAICTIRHNRIYHQGLMLKMLSEVNSCHQNHHVFSHLQFCLLF